MKLLAGTFQNSQKQFTTKALELDCTSQRTLHLDAGGDEKLIYFAWPNACLALLECLLQMNVKKAFYLSGLSAMLL